MEKLKEIIFGFVVIAALGVIFLPMLLTEKNPKKERAESTTPSLAEHKLTDVAINKQSIDDLNENKPTLQELKIAKQAVDPQKPMTAIATPEDKPTPAEKPIEMLPPAKPEKEEVALPPAPPVVSAPAGVMATAKQAPVLSAAPATPAAMPAKPVPTTPKVEESAVAAPVKEPLPLIETPIEPRKPEVKQNIKPKLEVKVEKTKPEVPKEETKVEEIKAEKTVKSEKAKPQKQQKPQKSQKPQKELRSGWTVQVGTFSVHENAVKLSKKLKSAGFSAYIKNLSRSTGEVTLVLVGPYSTQKMAREIQTQIEENYGLRGEVIHSSSKSTVEEPEE